MDKRFHNFLNILVILSMIGSWAATFPTPPAYASPIHETTKLAYLRKIPGSIQKTSFEDNLGYDVPTALETPVTDQQAIDLYQEGLKLKQALFDGDYPYQLTSSTGSIEPSRYGPQRNDPAEGIPKHAYSPFDEKNNREHPCPPGGCEFMEGQLIVKLAPEIQIQKSGADGALTNEVDLNQTLNNLGVLRLEPIFPNARKPWLGEYVISFDDERLPMPDLTLWQRAYVPESSDILVVAKALAATPGILYAEPDYLRKPVGDFSDNQQISSYLHEKSLTAPASLPGPATDPLYSQQWHLGATNVPQAWAYLEGLGLPPGGNHDIIVAVIDTGVDYTHPDLAANMWINPPEFGGTTGVDDDGNGYVDDIYGADTVYPDGDPQDDHGHGTHVAGIIAASAGNNEGGVGVAYNVQIMALKAAQYSGVLTSSDIAEAIFYAVQKGADVINMSFGGYTRSQVEEDALAVAFGQAVLVAAAGNDGKVNLPCPFGRDMYPAAYNWVLGVMASTPAGGRASFSNVDCTPHDTHEYELMTPGVDVWSTLPVEQYAAWDGTSMSAPIVSGIAALARTKWTDKDVYSSRFIMGQIAANTSGGVANAYAALTVAPEPELAYLEHWLFDTEAQHPDNDDDGVVDAGEVIDLAIVIRNHWGKADPVTVTLQAQAEGAVFPDPYVTMITDTVSYGAIGSFNWDDNGLIYDAEGVITGVRHPFRFSVAADTPNDHVIPFLLTMTAYNGLDPTDTTEYTFQSRFYLIVQRGRELRGPILEDLTLTKDDYWIISGLVGIASNVTMTIAEGTQVQWGSPAPLDPYSEPERARIETGPQAKFLIRGTLEEPVELFPMAIYNPYGRDVYINNSSGVGVFDVQYAKVMSPEWGYAGIYYGPNSIDHSYIYSDLDVWDTGFSMQDPPAALTNSIVIYWNGINGYNPRNADTNLFEAKTAARGTIFSQGLYTNNVFLQNNPANITWSAHFEWCGSDCFPSESEASEGTRHRGNAFLSKYWDPDIHHWMRITCYGAVGPTQYVGLAHNYWGTTSTTLIEAAISTDCKIWDESYVIYEPFLTTPYSTTYPFVWNVDLSTVSLDHASALNGPTPIVSAEPVTFTVTYNRDMDMSVQPLVSFGPDIPQTDYTIHPIGGGWQNERTWMGTFNVNPITGDGYQLMRIAGGRAADDHWLVAGDDVARFRFEIITSGTEAMNLQATGGEGYVDLAWTQDDFDLLSGFNLYRSTSLDGAYTRINASIIPPDQRTWRDTDVQPGQPYFYYFTVVKSDMTESDPSNTATATPIDTIPPVISHTPITSAPPLMPLTIYADVTDNVGVQSVTLYYRHIGATTYSNKTMILTTGNRYSATLEGALVTSPGVEYYIEAHDGISIVRAGRPEYPYQVTVVDQPVVTSVTPNHGTSAGGTTVTIAGSNFKTGASVTFGGAAASDVTVLSTSQIICTTPAHFPETVDVIVTNPDAQSGTLLRGFTFESDVASLSLPDTGGGQNATVQIPINLANVQGLAAASLTVTFDESVLDALGATTGSLTPGWSLVANTNTSGQVRISMASSGGTVSGAGTLALLEFDVVGSPGAISILHPTNILLNDGAIPVDTDDGSFTVDLVYDVSGRISYWNGGYISGTLMTLQGDRVFADQSDSDGLYTVIGAPSDDYTLTPTKSDDINGITAYDASLALQHDAGLITLSGHAFTAGDVNKSSYVTAMDAFYILQKSVDLITLPFTGAGKVWDFSPTNRSYTNLTSDLTNQDFTGILLGDASGNWSAINNLTFSKTLSDPAVLQVQGGPPDNNGVVTAILQIIPNGSLIYGLDLTFTFDADVATILDVDLGSATSDWFMASNSGDPGQLVVAMAGAYPITDNGVILVMQFQLSDFRAQTPLYITRGEINEGTVLVQLIDGLMGGGYLLYLPIIIR